MEKLNFSDDENNWLKDKWFEEQELSLHNDIYSYYIWEVSKNKLISSSREIELGTIITNYRLFKVDLINKVINWAIQITWCKKSLILLEKIMKIIQENKVEYEKGYNLRDYKKELYHAIESKKVTLLIDNKELQSFYATIDNYKNAKKEFFLANLKLVINIVKKLNIQSNQLSRNDIIQYWNMWLIKAIEKYNPIIWEKFASYAPWRIRQSIFYNLNKCSQTIHVKINIYELYIKINKVKIKLSHKLWRDTTYEEIWEELDMDSTYIENIVNTCNLNDMLSMDAENDDDWWDTLSNFIPSSIPSQEYIFWVAETKSIINDKILSVLNERERKIMKMRSWMDYDREYTLQEIWDILWISRQRANQIEAVALNKLKTEIKRSWLKLHDFVC